MDSLVSTEWLGQHLGDENLAVVDASWHLPAARRDPRAEFEAAHIPGARFLDLANFTDPASTTPSALPDAVGVAERLAALGIAPSMRIVLYDDSANKTAARAWFALRAHGLSKVAILDGGLAKWRAEQRPLESGVAQAKAAQPADLHLADGVVSKDEMLANIALGTRQVIDARSADRVFGEGIDPVHGGQNGRIPGSRNLPYGQLFAQDGTMKPQGDIRAAFESAGIDLSRPIIATCGSGVTACVLLHALEQLGHTDYALYDGSWQEWEADPATPKTQGPEQVGPDRTEAETGRA